METIVERLEKEMKMLDDGEIRFSEAGDWLHNNGDEILNELNWLREMLEK